MSILNCIEQSLQRQTVQANISYFMDGRFLPYGELAEPQLLQRLELIVTFLQRTQPDLVVIACNTASVQSLDFLRRQFNLPFVGVVPAIKPAAKITKSGKIGLLATPATVSGQYTQWLIEQFAVNCEVVRVGSSELVRLAEDYFWLSEENCLKQWQDHLNKLDLDARFHAVDTLVLGCTHFPLIAQHIADSLPYQIQLVDSGMAIAKRVCDLIELNQCIGAQREFKHLFSSAALTEKQQLRLNQLGFDSVELVEI